MCVCVCATTMACFEYAGIMCAVCARERAKICVHVYTYMFVCATGMACFTSTRIIYVWYVYIRVRTYVYTYIYISVWMCAAVMAQLHLRSHHQCVICIFKCTYKCVHVYVYVCLFKLVPRILCVLYVHVGIHTYVYMQHVCAHHCRG